MREWQKSDVSKLKPDMHRPEPPQLKEFINSQGSFSLSHLNETESKQIQGIIDYLCPHGDDGYYVRRWLWTQFPLIAVSFENLFLKKFTVTEELSSNGNHPISPTQHNDSYDANSLYTSSVHSSNGQAEKDAKTHSNHAQHDKSHAKAITKLPKATEDRKRIIARHSPKKNSIATIELLNPEDSGAFDFLDNEQEGDICLSIPALRVSLVY